MAQYGIVMREARAQLSRGAKGDPGIPGHHSTHGSDTKMKRRSGCRSPNYPKAGFWHSGKGPGPHAGASLGAAEHQLLVLQPRELQDRGDVVQDLLPAVQEALRPEHNPFGGGDVLYIYIYIYICVYIKCFRKTTNHNWVSCSFGTDNKKFSPPDKLTKTVCTCFPAESRGCKTPVCGV